MICPFFGKNEDYCDVGCSYISPSDVRKIIQFCSSHPDRCPLFLDLVERHPEEAALSYRDDSPASAPAAALLRQPSESLPRSEPSSTRPEPETEAVKRTATKPLSPADTLANPAPSGLLAFGMTTALLGLHHTGTFPLDSTMLGMGVFYGGLGQIVVGFVEWKRQHLFGAAAFTSFGLFWLSLIAMTILPGNRFGEFHQDTAMTAYLVLWGLFTAVLFLGALRLNRSLQFVLGSLILFYLLLAAGTATGSRLITAISGWAGVFCAFAAIYTGLAQILNEIFGRAVAPLGEHDRTMDQTIQKHPS